MQRTQLTLIMFKRRILALSDLELHLERVNNLSLLVDVGHKIHVAG
jgi:hypothetical protein